MPAFHAACLAQNGVDVAVLNLGGIANLSLLPAAGPVTGFDCGPGNVLLDQWCQQARGLPYDAGGAWAAQGKIVSELLTRALTEPFYALPAPKSTGRDLFDDGWVQRWLANGSWRGEDVAATLSELTAVTAVQSLRAALPDVTRLLVCGGGAENGYLMGRLQSLLGPSVLVASTQVAGLAPSSVEALAFAWLARACIEKRPGNLPAATGARGLRVLGAICPAA